MRFVVMIPFIFGTRYAQWLASLAHSLLYALVTIEEIDGSIAGGALRNATSARQLASVSDVFSKFAAITESCDSGI
jgi:hypothetical protein